MNKKQNSLGIFLALITGGALFVCMLLRAFWPAFILPRLDSSALLILSLAALVLDHYFSKEKARIYWFISIFSFLIFGLFPWLACFTTMIEALHTAIMGTVIFTVATLLFDSIQKRLSTTPVSKAAPLISAFGIFLAAQCLITII